MSRVLFFFVTLFIILNHETTARDFCVADLKAQDTPSGYPCKDPQTLTINDFVTSSLTQLTPPSNATHTSTSVAFTTQFPALNGVHMGATIVKFGQGGYFPMHSHPDATEMIYVTSGSIIAGFISSSNTPFVKTLKAGELILLPQGLFHFAINADATKPAEVFVTFNNHRFSVQIADLSLFGNSLDAALLQKTTSISVAEIMRLKGLLGGK